MKQKFKGLMYSWILTDDAIEYGGIFKQKILLNEIKNIVFWPARTPEKESEISLGSIRLFRLSQEEMIHRSESTGNYIQEDKGILLSYRYEQNQKVQEAVYYMVEHSGISEVRKAKIINSRLQSITGEFFKPEDLAPPSGNYREKDASVVGRAVVGGIVAGPAVAVVGALSTVDKNNRNKK